MQTLTRVNVSFAISSTHCFKHELKTTAAGCVTSFKRGRNGLGRTQGLSRTKFYNLKKLKGRAQGLSRPHTHCARCSSIVHAKPFEGGGFGGIGVNVFVEQAEALRARVLVFCLSSAKIPM